MALATEDKGFAVGLGVAVVVLVLYAVAARGPLRSATARTERDIRAEQPKVDTYFQNPKAMPFDQVHRELGKRAEGLEKRLEALVAAVEFDTGPLDPSGSAGAAADLPVLYYKLSDALHRRIEAKADEAAHLVRVPSVFDPQGKKQTPRDPAAIPRLHAQLVMAYLILDAAIDHRIDVTALRAIEPRLGGAPKASYLDKLAVSVKAQGGLDAVAAWLHALGQPPRGTGGSKFLSVASLEIDAGADKEKVEYAVTFVSVRVNPKVILAAGPARKADKSTPRRGPRRAPRY